MEIANEREAVQEGQSKGPAPLHCTGLLHLGHICLHDIAEDIPGDVGRRDPESEREPGSDRVYH